MDWIGLDADTQVKNREADRESSFSQESVLSAASRSPAVSPQIAQYSLPDCKPHKIKRSPTSAGSRSPALFRYLVMLRNSEYFIGCLPEIKDNVFIKLYIDPSYQFSDETASVTSDESFSSTVYLDNDVCNDLRREVGVVRGLLHSNIVLYYQEISLRGVCGYAMEYCKYGNLHDYIVKHGALGESAIRDVMKQMLEALSYLASKHIVHRWANRGDVTRSDIKTANILIADTGLYKLCDFGSCFVIEVGSARDCELEIGAQHHRGRRLLPRDRRVHRSRVGPGVSARAIGHLESGLLSVRDDHGRNPVEVDSEREQDARERDLSDHARQHAARSEARDVERAEPRAERSVPPVFERGTASRAASSAGRELAPHRSGAAEAPFSSWQVSCLFQTGQTFT